MPALFADDDGGYLRLKAAEYFKRPVPIRAKPVAFKAGKVAAEAAPAGEKPAAPARAASRLADAKATSTWSDRLQARVRAEQAANRPPRFASRTMRTAIDIEDIDATGLMQVKLVGGGSMKMPWSHLRAGDQFGLAQAVLRGSEPDDHALAAFFLLLDGQAVKAEEHLARAGANAEAVRAAFVAP